MNITQDEENQQLSVSMNSKEEIDFIVDHDDKPKNLTCQILD